MRTTLLESFLLLTSSAHASYNAITTLGHEICIPRTVQVTVTVTVDGSSGAEVGRSKSGPFDKTSAHEGQYVKSVAEASTTTQKHDYGVKLESDEAGTTSRGFLRPDLDHDHVYGHSVPSPARGSYEHGDDRDNAYSKSSSSHKSVTKVYGGGIWDEEEEAAVTNSGSGHGYGHYFDGSYGTKKASSTRGGHVAVSSSRPHEEHNPSYQSHLSYATPSSLQWSRWSNHSTIATTSKASSRSTSDAESSRSSFDHDESSSSTSTPPSSALSSSLSSDISKIDSTSSVKLSSSSYASSSSSSSSGNPTSSLSASFSSAESPSTSSLISSSSAVESSSSSFISSPFISSSTSSEQSVTSSITSLASSSQTSSLISSATSSAGPACVTAGDKIVNGGFSDNTIAPFTESNMVVGPSNSGVQNDYREDVDNDGRFYTAFFQESANGDTGVILQQTNLQIPSGTTVNCRASVRQSRGDGGFSGALLSIDGQPCGDSIFLLRESDTWYDYGGEVVVSGDSHTLQIILLAGIVPANELTVLSVDNIEVIPITLPAGVSFCPVPAVTCLNDGALTPSCSADSECCGFGSGSTCVGGMCTACFTPANILIDPSFGSGSFGNFFDPWASGIGRGGDREGDEIPTVEQGQSQDADGFSLSFPVSEAGPIYLSQNVWLPAGTTVTCSFWARDSGLDFTSYTLDLGGQTCAAGIGGPSAGSPSDWYEVAGSVTLTNDIGQISIELFSSAGNPIQEIDNIQIVLSSSPDGVPTCPAN